MPRELQEGETYLVEGNVWSWHVGEHIFLPIVLAAGMIGNALVIFIYQAQSPCSETAHFKKMFAFIDMASVVVLGPAFFFMVLFPDTDAYPAACVITSFLTMVMMKTTGFLLLMVAVDRYMKIRLPKKIALAFRTRHIVLAFSVAVAFFLSLPVFWLYGRNSVALTGTRVFIRYCYVADDSSHGALFLFHVASIFLVFLVVFLPILACYYNIGINVNDLSRRFSLSLEASHGARSHKKNIIIFATVSLMFFLSYAPTLIWLFVVVDDPTVLWEMSPLTKACFDVVRLCPLMNCMAKPCIYAFYSISFREEMQVAMKASRASIYRKSISAMNRKSSDDLVVGKSKDQLKT